MLDCSDSEIWCWLASEFKVSLHSLGQKRSLRSTSNYKKVFMKAYKKASQEIKEKHEILLLLARNFFLETARDCPRKLAAIVLSVFPDLVHFDVNWISSVVEANTLVTMCCRGAGRPKCLKLLLETYSAKIEIGDMGGFNPLILSAYHGNLSCTVYCVRRGANIFAVGRERSGIHLIAEHWASIRGHTAVRDYLRSIRIRLQKKIFNLSPIKVCPPPLLTGCAPPLLISPTPSNTPLSPDQAMNTEMDCTPYDARIENDAEHSLLQCELFQDLIPDSPEPQLWQAAHDISTTPLQSSSCSPISTSAIKSCSLNISVTDRPPLSCSVTVVSAASPSLPMQEACYCVCTRGHIGSMIQCDSADCPIGWFHYCCVGLTEDVPDDDYWLCPNCDSEDPLGRFPEPRLTLYSTFLKLPLTPLTIHTPAEMQISNLESKCKQKSRKYQCVKSVRPAITEAVAVTEAVAEAVAVTIAVTEAEAVAVSVI